MKIETYTWLASYPKSGNTWLRILISAYMQKGYVDINRLSHSQGDNLTFWLQQVSPQPVADLTNEQLFAIRAAALLNQLCASTQPQNFLKTHHTNMRFNSNARLIPCELTARAVYVIRDPRDVALSMASYLDKPVAEVVDDMDNSRFGLVTPGTAPSILGKWSSHVKSWVDEKAYPVAVLRYEDMVENTASEFAEFLRFCEIEPDMEVVEIAVAASALPALRKQENENGFREDRNAEADRPFFGKGGSRWKTELDPALARRIEENHGDMMRRYGYMN